MKITATKALAAFERRKPDLIVSDLFMPGGDRFHFIQRIRSMPEHAGGKVPAIALSALSGQNVLDQSLRAGFNHYLAKPITPDMLIRAVLKFLRHSDDAF